MWKKNQVLKRLVFIHFMLTANFLNIFAQNIKTEEIIWQGTKTEVCEGVILATLIEQDKNADFFSAMKEMDCEVLNNPDKLGVLRLSIPKDEEILSVIERLKKIEFLANIEPDVIDHICVTPNDTYYSNQWAHPKICSPSAWDVDTGSSSVIVGVLDSGIPMQSGSLSHPDLNNSNRILLGYDFVNTDNEPMDDCGHGTHVAGILSAESHNSTGVTGMSWDTKLFIVKVFNSNGTGSSYRFYQGVQNAVDNGAKIINYSGGGSANNYKILAINYAQNNDCLIIASAGNDDADPVLYPAAYSTSYNNVIAVSASDSSDNIADFSNVGSEINVAAPGVSIYSTMPNYSVILNSSGYNQNYDYMSGTSMSAPHVSGLAGLILSMNSSLTPSQVRTIIELSSEDLGTTGFDNYYGYGRIDAYEAVKNLYVPEIYSTISSAVGAAVSGQTIVVSESQTLSGNVVLPSGVSLTINSGATVQLGSYYLDAGSGSITVESNVTISPHIEIKSGSTLKGFYPSLLSALSNASSGETISVYSNQTISGTQTVPSGVTLVLKSGTITLATGASIVSSSGSIDIDGATVSPNIQVKASSNTIYGLYKTVQAALNATTATADYVSVYGGTFQENISISSGKSLYGYNNACIDGNVSLSSCTASDLSGLWVTGNVQVSYGSYVYLENLTMSGGRIDIDAGSGHTIDDVSFSNSAYIDLYQTSPEIYDVTSTNSTSYSIYAYQASPDICSGSFSYKTNAVYCASYADATVDGNFCNNTYDIFAGTGSDVDATGVNTFSDSDSADCIHTSGSGFVDLPATLNACGSAQQSESLPMLAKASGWSEIEGLFNDFRALKQQIRNDRKQNRKDFEPSAYHGSYQNLANQAKKLIADEDSRTAAKALRLYSYCCWALGEESQLLTLDKDVNMNDAHVNAVVLGLKVPVYAKNKQFDAALNTIDAILAAERDTESYIALLYRKGVLYENHIQDVGKAAEIYTRIVTEFADSPTAWAAQQRLDELEVDKEIQPETIVPEEMEFAIKNYPNPANPGTTIQFSLPQDGHVSLTIYNVMGQKVSELTNANMPKGVYNIRWNGMDGFGNAAASGMYFYRIVYENRVLTNKFLLMR